MNVTQLESSLIRILAIIALTAAVVAAIIITYNSGIIGGSGSSSSSEQGEQAAGQAEQSPGAGEDTAGAAQTGKTYVVQDGDSFYSIARKFNTSISDIQKLNQNVDPQNLTSGTRLNVP
ncbi:MAG: LysM domain-containing protein [Actinomycetota bacterium]